MSKEQEKSGLSMGGFSRRSFLRTAGVVSAAAVAAPFSPISAGSAMAKSVLGIGQPFRVGLLIPRGNWTTESMLNGISLHLKQIGSTIGGSPVELVVEQIKGGGSLQAKLVELVEQQKVNVVIGAMSMRIAQLVRKYIDERNVTFIEMNAGEVITAHEKTSPNYFRSTLNLWQAHAAMGSWAANTLGKKATVMTSFNNSGYDFHTAFKLGFELEGGHVTSTRITGAPTTSDHAMSVLPEVEKSGSDVLYASYSDTASYGFVQAYQSSGSATPVVGTDFREGTRGIRSGLQMDGSRYAGSWSRSLDTELNREFLAAYRDFVGKEADEYAVLGNDTIRMVLAAAAKGGNLNDALLAVGLNGPRDEMRFDPATRTLGTPVYVFESIGGVEHATELEYAASTRAGEQMKASDTNTGGWITSYLAG
jgi:branched-chain amino acid transport system substrate-binding protein